MAEKVYVVLGATGHVGSPVARRLAEARRPLRVVARSAAALAAHADAEQLVGSVEDPELVRRALDGAGAAFVQLPPYLGPGARAWQDRVAGILADGLEAARVPYAVALSSLGAQLASGTGPVAGLHTLEERLGRVPGLSVLALRPGYFFENHLSAIGVVRSAGFYAGALAPELRMAQIAAADVGEVAARRLLALDWRGREIQELHGERDVTPVEVARALGAAIGKPDLAYVQLSYADAHAGLVQAGLSEEVAALYVELARALNDGRIASDEPRSPATTTPTSIEAWAREVFARELRAG
ncbi:MULTISPECIES: NAD(P)H-binding protein [Anaeromyxobacter]|uniref:NAD(P)H-binding protein n=1 Tax=Anaeromyxobacter TaxID=161492 RepID=UPI001F581AD8|nr:MULTISPECIES: NAD(P)H-binding protein [unclassified Anaeromyxobacter]